MLVEKGYVIINDTSNGESHLLGVPQYFEELGAARGIPHYYQAHKVHIIVTRSQLGSLKHLAVRWV